MVGQRVGQDVPPRAEAAHVAKGEEGGLSQLALLRGHPTSRDVERLAGEGCVRLIIRTLSSVEAGELIQQPGLACEEG